VNRSIEDAWMHGGGLVEVLNINISIIINN
jgi:hypothetical protein